MKRLIVFAFIVSIVCVMNQTILAANVSLQWDPSPSADVEGYVILHNAYEHPYPALPGDIAVPPGGDAIAAVQAAFPEADWIGSGLTCSINAADDRKTEYVALAFGKDVMELDGSSYIVFSGHSNAELYSPPGKTYDPPVIIQILVAMWKAITGFFV